MEIFDEAGNLKKREPESDKVIPEKEVFCCQYCEKEWDNKLSNIQHERWCSENPFQRTYRNVKSVKKPKVRRQKPQIKSKTKISDGIDIIKELGDFDKLFGLTDEQIVKYIRDKIKRLK